MAKGPADQVDLAATRRGGREREPSEGATDEELVFVLSGNDDEEPAQIARVLAMRETGLAIERSKRGETSNDCN